ncbi:nucleoid-associated protein [Phascolarctobacterium faecium]|uniref:nucleoid-associated protein n=1 Tax=Phascolarctobacterium faecium TaxID=33025 RepID=UPI00210B3585|nr:nucleoid-associated protein [Phascolarctobacterium faecium]MCQ5184225.1 nucleoid-associated protein [Phascolarctobacterium faecium]
MNILANITVDKAITHFVPRNIDNTQPIMDERLTELDEIAKRTLIQRMTAVLGGGSDGIEMQIIANDETSIAAEVCKTMNDYENVDTFITSSKHFARSLHTAQNHRYIKDGVLLCFQGRTGETQVKYVAVIKAEPHDGFTKIDNKVSLIQDIFLSPSQKLYKIGFWVDQSTTEIVTPNDLKLYIYDHNMNSKGDNITRFFAESFLQCKPLETSAELTKQFFRITSDFIEKNQRFSTEEKYEKINALKVYLKEDQCQSISVEHFASRYFEIAEIKDEYTSLMRERAFPETSIVKETSKIKKELTVKKYKFSSGVKIQSPVSTTEKLIDILSYDEEDRTTTVKIKGRLES